MSQVHVIRHKVLVEDRSIRSTAREMGVSRNTVRKYLEQSEPKRQESGPRAKPVLESAAQLNPRKDGTYARGRSREDFAHCLQVLSTPAKAVPGATKTDCLL